MKLTVISIIICGLFVSESLAKRTGYESLLNWGELPKVKTGITAGLVSSYDRNAGNQDYNYYLFPEGFQTSDVGTIVTELAGPGIITRFWMPHATANMGFPIKMTIDGVVIIDTNSNTLLDGAYSYITSPLVQTLVGGQVSYEPIAFAESLKIESRNYGSGLWAKTHHYYQYSYHKLPSSEPIIAYDGDLTDEQTAARNAVVTMLNNAGSNPAGESQTAIVLTTQAQTITGGYSVILCNIAGSGHIRRLNVKMPQGATNAELENLKLRVRYDGQLNYAIDVPVAHFFGAGFGRVQYKSLPLGTDSPEGFYSYWPMPYRDSILIELYNNSGTSIQIAGGKVEYESESVSCEEAYLHAHYNKETTINGQLYHTLLNVAGAGHYVGNLLYVEKAGDSRSILEGDDIIAVNPGQIDEVNLYGTGMEDAYNGGYYFNHVLEQNNDGETGDPNFGIRPYHGLLYIDFYDMPGSTRTRADQYRWLIGDYIPFTTGIDVKIENYGNYANATFGSTAFYYLTCSHIVNWEDYAAFASYWLENCGLPNWCNGNDFDQNSRVDVNDLAEFTGRWLDCAD